MNIFTEI